MCVETIKPVSDISNMKKPSDAAGNKRNVGRVSIAKERIVCNTWLCPNSQGSLLNDNHLIERIGTNLIN